MSSVVRPSVLCRPFRRVRRRRVRRRRRRRLKSRPILGHAENQKTKKPHFRKRLLDVRYLLRCFFFSLSLSHLAPRTVSLPSFLEGLLSFLGLPRVTRIEG